MNASHRLYHERPATGFLYLAVFSLCTYRVMLS